MPNSWILAVDFGTTNTAAAIRFADGRVEKVKLDPSSDTMPSAVVLTDGQWRVGRAALNARWTNPQMFVGSPKSRLGQEPVVMGSRLVDPALIASVVLAAVRERAAAAAGGGAPDRLVLTHPASWGQARLTALREAARLGGFPTDSVRLLPEPIAALHAHVQPGSLAPGARVAVVDIGGGTCDVAVLQVTDDPAPGKDLLVVAQEGDERLGGNDLDGLLYQWVLSQLGAHGRTDLVAALGDPAHRDAAMTLLDMVRAAKQDLSEHANAPVAVSVAGQKVALTVTRDEYERLIAGPVARAAALTTRALKVSGTTRLAGLYLTGGTAYTPALARSMHQVTGILTAPIGDPKLVVAVGALKTPTAVMTPSQLHRLTQELKANRTQETLAGTTSPAATSSPSRHTGPTSAAVTPYQSNARPDPHPGRRRKAIAGALATVLVVGTAGVLWTGSSRGWFDSADPERPTSSPLSALTRPDSTCWDGSTGSCPVLTSSDAVEYAFTPPYPDQCQMVGSDIYAGMFYVTDCSVEERRYKPYAANLQLWADNDAIEFGMAAGNNVPTDTWKNSEGAIVGSTYTPTPSSGSGITRCYDAIPFCLEVDEEYAFEEFGTLSSDQIRDFAAWLATHPVPDPTDGWDPKTAERAFPAAAGVKPLTCAAGDLMRRVDQQFNCEWSDGKKASVTVWTDANEAIEFYTKADGGKAEPWIYAGVERGRVFSGGDLGEAKMWCYSDIPYCIKIDSRPDDLMARISPLTKDQAAKF